MLQEATKNRHGHLLSVMVIVSFAIAGCVTTTERQLLQSQIELNDRAIEQSHQLLSQLQSQSGGPGPYDAKAYVSTAILNDALSALNGLTFAIPGVANATGRVNQVRLIRYGTLPAIVLDAQAIKSDLTIQVTATAALSPVGGPGNLKLSILSFVPDVRWSWIDFTKSKFIRELLAVEVSKITDRMPVIHLPANGNVTLGGPPIDQDVTFQLSSSPSFLTMRIRVPATQWSPMYDNTRYYFLGDGLFVFGDLQ